jgi:predicted unusual protein kinase regulating ubiquinone biosynthesis (AarF/ABC1/UbiB family)
MSIVKEVKKIGQTAYGLMQLNSAQDEEERKRAARYLAQLFGEEKGIFLKIGQMIGASFQADEEFQNLVTMPLEPLPLDVFVPLLRQDLGENWNEKLIFNLSPGLVASIGQVHQAMDQNGQMLAVKLQLPGMREKISNQLRLFQLLPQMGPVKKWGVPLEEYKTALQTVLKKELDYRAEYESLEKVNRLLSGFKNLVVPKPVKEFSSGEMLVQEWQQGLNIAEIDKLKWSSSDKRTIAQTLVKAYFYLLLNGHVSQGDYNPGNFLFRDNQSNPEVVMIDFGNLLEFSKSEVLTLLQLIMRAQEKGAYRPFDYLVQLGFEGDKLKHIGKQVPLLTQLILEPLTTNYAFDLSTWQLTQRMDSLLQEYKWWFRASGAPQFFLLMKSFFGLVKLVERLNVNINWYQCFSEVVGSHENEIRDWSVAKSNFDSPAFSALAKNLSVIVVEDGFEKVNLTMPAAALEDLPTMVDHEVAQKIAERGLDLNQIVQKAMREGGLPGVLFQLEDGPKSYLVALK